MGFTYEVCCTKCNVLYDIDKLDNARRFIDAVLWDHKYHDDHVAVFFRGLSDMDIERDDFKEIEFKEILDVYDKGQDCMHIEDFIRTLDDYSPRRWQFKRPQG